MSQAFSDFDISQLDSAEKLSLISQLWDSLPDTMASLPMPDWHRQELEQRLTAADASPDDAIPWEHVRERLRPKP
jgi:putative addiction module component (TIGR02574 family)